MEHAQEVQQEQTMLGDDLSLESERELPHDEARLSARIFGDTYAQIIEAFSEQHTLLFRWLAGK